jgi:PAS domain-containing protein
MPADDEMTIAERRKYLRKQAPRYRAANRTEKGRLSGKMEAITGLHRKSLIRLLGQPSLERRRSTTRRRRSYGLEVERVVAVVWESLDYVCAERLQPALPATAAHLARFGECQVTPAVASQLETISVATVQRMLTRLGRPVSRLPQRGPEQANRLRQATPMRRIPWETVEPGHLEVDLVHHAGGTSAGEYAHTLQLIDVATGWSERVALLGRSQRAMETAFRQVLARIPFPILELHPDNGREFFNAHLVRFFGEELTGLTLTRSRPYQKNDNRFVEQKNATLVRAYLGSMRLETPAHVTALNALYEQGWIYYNLFQPVLHLAEKTVVAGRLRRHWDTAQTPYQRLIAAGGLAADDQHRLGELYARTNPRALRHAIERDLRRLWSMPQTITLDLAAD